MPIRKQIGILGLVFFIVYLSTYQFFGAPSNAQLIDQARHLYAAYGPSIALVAGFLEAIIVVGEYVPGSGVVLLGAVFSAEGILDVRWVTSLAIVGFLAAYCLDYLIGKHGWYRLLNRIGYADDIQRTASRLRGLGRLHRFAFAGLFYFDPDVAAGFATSSGIMRLDFREFASVAVVASIAWNSMWAALAYHFGTIVLTVLTTWLVVPAVLAFFALTLINLPGLFHWIKSSVASARVSA